jgi:predicted PurR-regulated permease PerM
VAGLDRNSRVFLHGVFWAAGALSTALLLYGLFALRNVALILALAGFWAYFLAWPARELTRWFRPRVATRIAFYTSFLVLLGMLGPIGTMLYSQINDLISLLPTMAVKLEESLAGFRFEIIPGQSFSLTESLNNSLEELRQNAPSVLAHAFDVSQTFLTGTVEVLVAMLLIPLIALYFLLDSNRLKAALIELFPLKLRGQISVVLDAVNRSLGNYIQSRVLSALFASLSWFLVLLFLQVPFALLLGVLAFLMEFIPVAGAWVALIPTCLIVLADNPPMIWWVLLSFGLIQVLQAYLLTPRLMSETMDLHPLTVIVAMLIGGSIGGFAGLLLAIPAVAAVKVVLNVFLFRRPEKGVQLPSLDLIGAGQETVPDFRPVDPAMAAKPPADQT